MPAPPHPCDRPAPARPGAPDWQCPECGAVWRSFPVMDGMVKGMWLRTYAEVVEKQC
ncbi:MAG: hypothetical protein ACRDNK_19540 [Solirubrobacteraceae bacterium]